MASPSKLTVGDRSYEIHRLDALQASYDVARLPYTLRVLLENVLRNGDEADVAADLERVWREQSEIGSRRGRRAQRCKRAAEGQRAAETQASNGTSHGR